MPFRIQTLRPDKLIRVFVCTPVLLVATVSIANLDFQTRAIEIPPYESNRKFSAVTPTPTPNPDSVVFTPEPPDNPITDELTATDFSKILFGSVDADCDGIKNDFDNCPLAYNPNQKDSNRDKIGDACDGKRKGRIEIHCDFDRDGVPDYRDNCGAVCNPNQTDKNKNGVGDACDPSLLDKWVRISPCEAPVPNKKCPNR